MLEQPVSHYLGSYWRNTPLYAEKLVPLLDYCLSNNYVFTDKMSSAFYELINKYQDTTQLPVDNIREFISEQGYGYIADLFIENPENLKLVVYLLALIHDLKGTEAGVRLVLDLLSSEVYAYRIVNTIIHHNDTVPTYDEFVISGYADSFKKNSRIAVYNDVTNYSFTVAEDAEYDGVNNTMTIKVLEPVNVAYKYNTLVLLDLDTEIVQWYQTLPVSEENTFTISTNLDASKVGTTFFSSFGTFIHNYVYPELKELEARYAVTAKRQQIPVTQFTINFTAYGELD